MQRRTLISQSISNFTIHSIFAEDASKEDAGDVTIEENPPATEEMQTDEPVASTSTASEEVKKEEDVALATPRTTRRSTRMLHVASPVESPEAEVEESQESGEAGDESFTASMSLDVLAQVATETLEKEPVSKSKVQFAPNKFLILPTPEFKINVHVG